ncbi:MAG: hypothetical protein M3077_03165 [Candidatus Dormibacteraeota bacterium]|nr:hypothetical protein [Candidatus Dormibacteraeota bacterium]
MSPTLVEAAVAEARAALLEVGGRETTPLAAGIERLAAVPAFSVMATASIASRPQWAGLVDDLFERPALRNARAGLRNALASTLSGDTLYRNVFFSFADAVILWHYGHTQERTGAARLDVVYAALLRLLRRDAEFLTGPTPEEPDVAFFHRLRRIKLTQDDAYPLLRRAGRLIGAVEAEVSEVKIHAVRGSMLTSYLTFSGQVIAMARALREGRAAIAKDDVTAGLLAMLALLQTAPADLPR